MFLLYTCLLSGYRSIRSDTECKVSKKNRKKKAFALKPTKGQCSAAAVLFLRHHFAMVPAEMQPYSQAVY